MDQGKEPAAGPIGSVSREERDLIHALNLRKTGLAELFASICRMTDDEMEASKLYERLVQDMGAVALEYQRWWDAMADKYGWQRQPDRSWRIDFDSCAIYIE